MEQLVQSAASTKLIFTTDGAAQKGLFSTMHQAAALTARGQAAHWAVIVVGMMAIAVGLALSINAISGAAVPYVDFEITSVAAGVAAGILATTLLQSSTLSSMLIVTAASTGVITPQVAIAAVLGANLGTTFTPCVTAFLFLRSREEFRIAQEVAAQHFWFNALGVLTVLPLELAFHPLETITANVELGNLTRLPTPATVGTFAWWKIALGLALLFAGMHWVKRRSELLIRGVGHPFLDRTNGTGDAIGLLTGVAMTTAMRHSSAAVVTVQSMAASRSISTMHRLCVILGANIATTLGAVFAALSLGSLEALQVAMVHLLFNLFGTLIVLLVPPARNLIDSLARGTAAVASYSYVLTAIGIAVFWLGIPMLVL